MKMMPLNLHTIVRSISIVSVLLLLSMSSVHAIDIKDWFPLSTDSWWHYTDEGSSTDNDFKWTVLSDKIDVEPGFGEKWATKIRTNTDDPTDDRHLQEDFWYVDTSIDNNLFYYGLYLPKALGSGSYSISPQTIILDNPLKIGHNGMKTTDPPIEDTATATVSTGLGPVAVIVDSTVTYEEMVSEIDTPLGKFFDVARLTVELEIVKVGPFPTSGLYLIYGEFWLVENIGMVKHDLEPGTGDYIQLIDGGNVNGVDVEGEKSVVVPAIPGLLLLN